MPAGLQRAEIRALQQQAVPGEARQDPGRRQLRPLGRLRGQAEEAAPGDPRRREAGPGSPSGLGAAERPRARAARAGPATRAARGPRTGPPRRRTHAELIGDPGVARTGRAGDGAKCETRCNSSTELRSLRCAERYAPQGGDDARRGRECMTPTPSRWVLRWSCFPEYNHTPVFQLRPSVVHFPRIAGSDRATQLSGTKL
mmetsp:Transcript_85617/g.242809  ORF Transcript_85617/g.242809 Transcript_85617/m.242809 type:complete len:200 (+) Transcript_85617:530-1129(+)